MRVTLKQKKVDFVCMCHAVKDGLQDRVLPAVRTDANLVRAPMVRAPVVFSFPSSKGAKDYGRLAEILLTETGPESPAPPPA